MVQFTGIVKSLKQKEFTTQDGTTLVKNEINVDVDGKTKMVLKFTRPETTFAISKGTRVMINGEEQEDKYGNTQVKVNSKPESFILLDQDNKPKDVKPISTSTQTGPLGNLPSKAPANTLTKAWDGDGAKRGNALTNAVTILLHNKGNNSISAKDEGTLLELARMVYRVSTAMETPETVTTSNPAKELDNDISPFD